MGSLSVYWYTFVLVFSDKGISVSTLDDFALGDENELLQRMTKKMATVLEKKGEKSKTCLNPFFFT